MQDREKLVEEMLAAQLELPYDPPSLHSVRDLVIGGADRYMDGSREDADLPERIMSAALSIAEAAFAQREAAIRTDEREACAKVAGDWRLAGLSLSDKQVAHDIAAAIRARESGRP
jgi:hypothetical protein